MELATVFYCFSTVFNKTPVREVRIAPPKNRRNHRQTQNGVKVSMNGHGAAEMRQKIVNNQVYYSDFLVEYPPSFVVILPPTTTPSTGPVMLIAPKLTKTTASFCFITTSM